MFLSSLSYLSKSEPFLPVRSVSRYRKSDKQWLKQVHYLMRPALGVSSPGLVSTPGAGPFSHVGIFSACAHKHISCFPFGHKMTCTFGYQSMLRQERRERTGKIYLPKESVPFYQENNSFLRSLMQYTPFGTSVARTMPHGPSRLQRSFRGCLFVTVHSSATVIVLGPIGGRKRGICVT